MSSTQRGKSDDARRRGFSRRVATVAAVAAVVALAVGATASLRTAASEPRTVAATPRGCTCPGGERAGHWSDEEGPTGPLAALGLGLRTTPQGLTGEKQRLQLFGVSAVGGRSAGSTCRESTSRTGTHRLVRLSPTGAGSAGRG